MDPLRNAEREEAERLIKSRKAMIHDAEVRTVAAGMGIAPRKLKFISKLAATEGIDFDAPDAKDKIRAAIETLLQEIPELGPRTK